MKRLIHIVAVLAAIMISADGYAQNFTNRGREFWVGYGHHQYMEPSCDGNTAAPNDMNMVLYLSAEQPARVTVTIDSSGNPPFLPAWSRTYNITANTVIQTENLPKGATDAGPSGSSPSYDARLFDIPPPIGTGGEGIWRKRGIHIVSDVPIVAYAHIYGGVSSGATMLLPIETWGYTYTSINTEQRNADRSYSWMYVIAKDDHTRISVTPSALSRRGRVAGVPFTVDLMKGQIYQYVAQSDCATGDGPELTGSTVKSIVGADGVCHPVAFFSGSSRTGGETLTCGPGSGRDNDMQQGFPEHAWGRRYLTAPFSKASGILQPTQFQTSVYKIVVKDPGTIVKRNGVQLTGIIGGKYYKFSSNTADYIEADKPVMVAQYMSGTGICNGGQGDPEMIFISPIEQAITAVGFYRNTRQAITHNYLTLIVPTPGLPSLRIDGSSFIDHSYPHPNLPGYTVVVKGWASAQAQVLVRCDSSFNAITYGLGGAESYGYNAGTFLKNLNAQGEIFNTPDTSNKPQAFTCTGTPMEITALIAYKPSSINWRVSTLAAVITPNADVLVTNPVVIDSVVVGLSTYYRYRLPGTYVFSDTGKFDLPLICTSTNIDNCSLQETLQISITVRNRPSPDFSFVHTGCRTDSVTFNGPVNTGAYNVSSWRWNFGDATADSIKSPKKVYAATGTYNVKLTVTSTEGCIADTTKPITIGLARVASVFTSVPAACSGTPITFNDTTTVTVGKFYWDFGFGTPVLLTSNTPQTVMFPAAGTYTVRHVILPDGTCPSDTVYKTIRVYAKPVPSFTYPVGCLPANGIVQFNSTTLVPDSQALAIHNWNFGDPNATPLNPNVSSLANPTHTYAYGTYTILYSVTTVNGCTKDTTVVASFNVSPVLSFSALPALCESSNAISIANGSVTNGVTGVGYYRGPGTDSAGLFRPSIAGAGTHTIWYVFTSTGGCKDSLSRSIVVSAAPKASFTFSNGCLPTTGLVQFTNTSTISDGQALTYQWNFGDPNANAANPNTSTLVNPSHNFGVASYNIRLTVTSANGCLKDTTVAATFTLKPQLNYPALQPVCENVAAFSVATATVLNAVAGIGSYRGPGTNAAGLFTPASAGVGTHTIWFVYTATGGCKDSVSQTVAVSAAPKVSFTFSNGCLPTNGLVQFTNSSTISDGQALSYLWNFGDPNANAANPNTSTQQNPSHNFGVGSYSIRLIVTSANGCTKDSVVNANFTVKPALGYTALAPLCENASQLSIASGTVTNGVPGSGIYRGAGTDSTGLFKPFVAGAGTHTIWFVYTATGGCKDSVSQTILVYAAPKPSFIFSNGCLPVSGLVQFNNTSTIADAQTLTYNWNFGDPNANAANPNTSTQQNPSHNYNYGAYTIKLTVQSSNGCVKDTTVAASFNVKPLLAYPALTAVCENISSVSVASGSVTNAVPGAGIYRGPGVDTSGTFRPAVAGAGNHTVWFVFTSTGGCKDSVAQTIRVHAKPVTVFTYPAGCLPTSGLVQFNNTTTITDPQTLTYSWNFGDAAANLANPNTSTALNPSHNFINNGTYAIRLTVTTANGCVGDTTRTATFSVKPLLSYGAVNSVCQSQPGSISVANATVVNGVSGTGIYRGLGTTSVGVFNAGIAGAGTHTLWYIFTSTGGCTDSVSTIIKVLPKPAASFTVNNNFCLNQQATFIPSGSISTGIVSSYNWNFGDGNSTTYNNTNSFSRSYAIANSYTVRMVAVSDSGCSSDTALRTINARPLPVANFNLPTGVCMPNGTAVFTNASSITDNSALTYSWNFGDGSAASANINPSHVYAASGTYPVRLTVTSQYGCTNDTVKTLSSFFDKPVAGFSVAPTILCQGTSTIFSDRSFAPNSTVTNWSWNFGDGSPAVTTKNPTKKYNQPGNYAVTLTVSNAVGCSSDVFVDSVFVYLQPVIDAGPSFVVAQGTTVQFRPVVNATNLQFVWSPGNNLVNATSLSQSIVASTNQTYTLTAIGPSGCTASDTLTVKILKPVIIPNSFSPNGDGINDTWVIPNLIEYPNMSVEVYNRYGQLVLVSKGYSTPWNGTYKGQPLPFATYYYVVNLKNGFAPLTGSVTIVK